MIAEHSLVVLDCAPPHEKLDGGDVGSCYTLNAPHSCMNRVMIAYNDSRYLPISLLQCRGPHPTSETRVEKFS